MSQNCYAYAVNYNDRIDPGELSGPKYADNSDSELIRAAERDGLEFISVKDRIPPNKTGYYLVALIATSADTSNYHWIRMELDRHWTHKAGEGSPQKHDAVEKKLKDTNPPHSANFNFQAYFTKPEKMQFLAMAQHQGWAVNYDRFVGYFYCPNGGLTKKKASWDCVIQ
ncbi:MAG: hypothetical protein R2729_21000 [Bryobacteraceae bacterium]